jgi:hypothetical protein
MDPRTDKGRDDRGTRTEEGCDDRGTPGTDESHEDSEASSFRIKFRSLATFWFRWLGELRWRTLRIPSTRPVVKSTYTYF